MKQILFVTTMILAAGPAAAQSGDQQHHEMTRRGEAVMGFPADKTTHHFRLRANGGEIEVVATDPRDQESVREIRGHLRHIARKFAAGNFTAPMLIHAQDPPGTEAMAARKGEIAYAVELVPSGARVRIRTSDREALDAIHAFLRFQITDHRTGDPLTIQK
jgi:hypothetical protein